MRNTHNDASTIAEDNAERIERKRRSKASARHVRLYYALLESEAWKALSHVERSGYVEFCKAYNGGNNGRIAMSVRDLKKLLGCSDATACRTSARLEEVGLIRPVKRGVYTKLAQTRRATEWRLTDYKCDVTGSGPTREWRRWKRSDRSTREAVPFHQGSTTVPPGKRGNTTVNSRTQQNGVVDRFTENGDRSTREAHIELPDGRAGASAKRARRTRPQACDLSGARNGAHVADQPQQSKQSSKERVASGLRQEHPCRDDNGIDAKETISLSMTAALAKIARKRKKSLRSVKSKIQNGKI
jgi:hypothetical protein